ncbi:hypothetical protein BDW74DRAFT_175614 [Aspergillus multicolor]|uniref:uncharacterized protein n=1 Tax=Aspergillus multicolor TaxID=41759 RepID=UPI003CCE1410
MLYFFKATTLQPVLLPERKRGVRVRWENDHPEDRLLTATAICTVSFSEGNNGGDLRDYLVVSTHQANLVAIVHRGRKKQGKENIVVYGLSVEQDTFYIFHIDSMSRVHWCHPYELHVHYTPGEEWHKSEAERIYPAKLWDRIYA